jgi:hypothetical protein
MIGASQVILVEGEKSAQSLINIGICATTAMNGARAPVDKTDWSPLAGKEVFIWPDKDKPGWEYAESVAGVLKEAGVTKLYILYPREEWPEKYDAADAVMEGLDIKAFLTDAKRLEFKTNNSFLNIYDWRATRYQGDAPEQKFLVANIFPLGVVSILAAMGDTGKGMLTLNLALQVAIGEQPENSINQQPLSFGSIIQAFGTAVIFTAEDDQNEIHRRLERLDPQRQRLKRPDKLMVIPLPNAGGTFPLVAITKEGFEATKQYKAIKEQLLKIADLKLIVFDPLSSFIHADVNADPVIQPACLPALHQKPLHL